MEFNKEQLECINHKDNALSCIASAGSGKSTVLVNRIKNLVEVYGIPQSEILAITFTHNTRLELKKKLKDMSLSNVEIHTFHSLAGKQLVQYGIVKREPNDNEEENTGLNKYALMAKFKAVYKDIKNKGYDDILSFVSYQKSYMLGYNDEFVAKESNFTENDLRKFYKIYEDYKASINYLDFDDLLLECNKLMDLHPEIIFNYVLCDEMQDLCLSQVSLLHKWCKSGNMFGVFDYRQTLYRFRGAEPEYCMNFDKDWGAKVVNLSTNYRSCKNIVEKSNSFIKKYYGWYEHYEDSVAANQDNGVIKLLTSSDGVEEAVKVVNEIKKLLVAGEDINEICILYRLNVMADYIESLLKSEGIEYDIKGNGSFFKRKEVASIIAILKLVKNPHDNAAFLDLYNARLNPLKFFNKNDKEAIDRYKLKNDLSYFETLSSITFPESWKNRNLKSFTSAIFDLKIKYEKTHSIESIIDMAKQEFKIRDYLSENYQDEEVRDRMQSIETLKLFVKGQDLAKFLQFTEESLEKKTKKDKKDSLKMMTIHGSKGLQFKHVFVVSIQSEKFPHAKANILDEAMLFYVSITRSVETLTLSQIGQSNVFVEEYFS